MTPEELLAKINDTVNRTPGKLPTDKLWQLMVNTSALRAVVELAFGKNESVEFWSEEGQLGYEIAMRRVIQAIEKELG